jgi:MoxR-like ATPase
MTAVQQRKAATFRATAEQEDMATWSTPGWLQAVQQLGPGDEQIINDCLPIVRKRLGALVAHLGNLFEGKSAITELVCICAIAQEPMLILGPPGTAKSDLVVKFAEGLGLRRAAQGGAAASNGSNPYFEYLLNQYTEPDELLGPVIVQKLTLAKPEFQRFRDGMMPNSYVVFLDEVFRGNSAILNALLSLINERRVYEAGTAVQAHTLILYGAANQPPVAEELRAFYERFPIRVYSDFVPLQEPGQRLELLKKGWALESQRLRAASNPNVQAPQQIACLTDLVLCNRAVALLFGGATLTNRTIAELLPAYTELVTALNLDKRQLCVIDDRKFVKLYKIIRATALFQRGEPPKSSDLRILKHTWSDIESREILAEFVDFLVDKRQGK